MRLLRVAVSVGLRLRLLLRGLRLPRLRLACVRGLLRVAVTGGLRVSGMRLSGLVRLPRVGGGGLSALRRVSGLGLRLGRAERALRGGWCGG
ncbi:hypothetical protein WKI71_32325 [Streptomyces sp. MS1.AVA.1]|uniref:Secreted protein n=1 Tax=Streptomyces machairae TaxID=3134109 RepID=A0ABU8UR27_9ACTN